MQNLQDDGHQLHKKIDNKPDGTEGNQRGQNPNHTEHAKEVAMRSVEVIILKISHLI